eukprot:gene8049-1283_t
MSFELYRQTQMGDCLCDALEEQVNEGKLTQELAVSVLQQFDKSMLEALRTHVSARATIKANLKHYRYYENIWQFTLEDVNVRINQAGNGTMLSSPEIICDKARVVCVDAKLLEITPS